VPRDIRTSNHIESMQDVDRESLLRDVVSQLIMVAVTKQGELWEGGAEDVISSYLNERLGHCKTSTAAGELVKMARDIDPDVDHWLLADNGIEMILVGDDKSYFSGETLLERYLDYCENYQEYELIHPSDYTGPREETESAEAKRISRDFAELVREWRDGFLQELIEDVRQSRTNGRQVDINAQWTEEA
jgi:hypothetical protein